jgi:threonine aldolase
MHADAARGLNAAAALDMDPAELFEPFDTINICLSKALGCPIGSVLMGTHEHIDKARHLRKMVGGGARQTGLLSVCGLVALEDWKEKLTTDHDNAKHVANLLSTLEGIVIDTSVVESNIFRFTLDPAYTDLTHIELCTLMKEDHDILFNPGFKGEDCRFVTHCDVTREQMDHVFKVF